MSYEYYEDIPDLKYSFGDRLPTEVIRDSYSRSPVFAFDYLDLDQTDYHFNQKCFSAFDAKNLLRRLKEISGLSVDHLIDNTDYSDHFHIYHSLNPCLFDLLKRISGKEHFSNEETPLIGQLALYTNPKGANRDKNQKSPRIYFIVGSYAVLYILFFDPYHEINPG